MPERLTFSEAAAIIGEIEENSASLDHDPEAVHCRYGSGLRGRCPSATDSVTA
jgi:hypothetical protein